ncbi:uncharacterized protein ACNLHF_008623 [Anomaloglossus baeobatrachus]
MCGKRARARCPLLKRRRQSSENFINLQGTINTWMSGFQNDCNRKGSNKESCKGKRICLGKEFKHGSPGLLVNIIYVPTCNQTTSPPSPETLPSTITFIQIRYNAVAVTYNTGDHFVCFHCMDDDRQWTFYDGMAEHLRPGDGVKHATPQLLKTILKPGVTPGHIIFVRQNDDTPNN